MNSYICPTRSGAFFVECNDFLTPQKYRGRFKSSVMHTHINGGDDADDIVQTIDEEMFNEHSDELLEEHISERA